MDASLNKRISQRKRWIERRTNVAEREPTSEDSRRNLGVEVVVEEVTNRTCISFQVSRQ